MKRHCGLAFTTFIAVVLLVGCGGGSDTGEGGGAQTQTGGAGGVGGASGMGQGGGAAVGSFWAPVPTGGTSGAGGIGGASGAAGMVSPGGAGGMGPGGAGGMGPGGAGGMGPGGAGGMGPGGAGGMGSGGSSATGRMPTIPAVTEECPTFADGTITFMGLGGITIQAGAKPASATAPMVFYWHGTLSSSGEYAFMASDVLAGVKAEGGVLVSFQGTTGGDGLSGTAIFGEGDFALADQLAACAVQNHNVDPRRIFATGCSAGGLFSTAMAAKRSSYIAAAAPNSGGFTFPVGFETDYTPALMTVHGAPGADVVGVDFSNTSATADTAFKGRGGFVVNCNHGGGHCQGGGLAGSIWEFFKAHPYGVEPSPSPWTSLPAGFDSSCEIF